MKMLGDFHFSAVFKLVILYSCFSENSFSPKNYKTLTSDNDTI